MSIKSRQDVCKLYSDVVPHSLPFINSRDFQLFLPPRRARSKLRSLWFRLWREWHLMGRNGFWCLPGLFRLIFVISIVLCIQNHIDFTRCYLSRIDVNELSSKMFLRNEKSLEYARHINKASLWWRLNVRSHGQDDSAVHNLVITNSSSFRKIFDHKQERAAN